MPILQAPPADVFQCRILQTLAQQAHAGTGALEKARDYIQVTSPLMDLIMSGPFKEYTLHNRDHAKKLLHLCEYVIPESTFTHLSTIELLIIVYSAYLHDLGMALSSTERQRILNSSRFRDTVKEWQELSAAFDETRAQLAVAPIDLRPALESRLFQLQEAALAAYLRPRHATQQRYHEAIVFLKQTSHRQDLFEFQGVSFEDELINICVSHNCAVDVLAEVHGLYEERFQRQLAIAGQYLNTQFCAAILRLTDILDFDRERTPPILFESLGISARNLPGSEVSLREWQKHMSVHTIDIRENEIVISADTRHPVIEKTIREFCSLIEREIRDTAAVIRRNTPDIVSHYSVDLPVNVRPEIRATGYVFKDMSFRVNESAIMSLLMGDRLYTHPGVPIRELVQNSIDACAARREIEGVHYQPDISISTMLDSSERQWLVVQDNGLGMDEYVLSEFFLTLGNSYHDSSEFGRLLARGPEGGRGFTPISRFGIGIVSIFMIADVLEVETRAAHSPRLDTTRRTVRVERMGGLAFVTESDVNGDPGTIVRVRLKQNFNAVFDWFFVQIRRYIQDIIVRPKYPIKVCIGTMKTSVEPQTYMSSRASAKQWLADQGMELVFFDLSRWSDRISGPVAILFGSGQDGLLSHTCQGHQIRLSSINGINPDALLDHYVGNRITVNGFKMGLKKVSKLLGLGDDRLAVALDIDIRGDADLIYDVSRDKIIGTGRNEVQKSFREAVVSGLKELGIMEKMDIESRDLINRILESSPQQRPGILPTAGSPSFKFVTDEDLLSCVIALMPAAPWPADLARSIAQQLNISISVAHRSIQTLISTRRVRSGYDKSSRPPVKHITDLETLKAVASKLPNTTWPLGLHRIVAEQLGIPSSLSYRAISTLIDTGQVVKPSGISATSEDKA